MSKMNDEDRAELAKKLQSDLNDYVSSLKPKKYEDGWPEDKWEEEMEKHPIFMSKPLEEGQDMPPLVEAFQQLKYDSEFNSPKELALSYKEDGNQNFKRKKYRWAVEAYTKAIDTNCEDQELNAVLYSNRATALFHIGSYRKALKDCIEAKSLNPHHLKAIHRGAMCSFELKEYVNCISWCDEGLLLNVEDKILRDLKNKAIEQREKVERIEKETAEQALKEKLELKSLNKAIKERGICCEGKGLTAKSFEPVTPEAVGSKVYLTEEGELVWPILFLYPEFGQSDFIRACNEETNFHDLLVMMFNESPGWDVKKEYKSDNLQVYFTDTDGKLVPVNRTKSLRSAMCHKRFILKSGILIFFVTISDSDFDKSFREQILTNSTPI